MCAVSVLQVISGGEKHRLDEVFCDLPIWLAAENGAVIRPPGAKVRTSCPSSCIAKLHVLLGGCTPQSCMPWLMDAKCQGPQHARLM